MRVDLNEWLTLRRRVVFGEDGGDGADWHARVAVHAFVGLDVEHPRTLVDAVDRTFVDAGAVLHIDAGLCDYVGHATSTPSRPAVVVKPQHTRREHVRDIVVASWEEPESDKNSHVWPRSYLRRTFAPNGDSVDASSVV